jgi:hypothetical protein
MAKAGIAWRVIEEVNARGGRFLVRIGRNSWRLAEEHEVLKKVKVSLKDAPATEPNALRQ